MVTVPLLKLFLDITKDAISYMIRITVISKGLHKMWMIPGQHEFLLWNDPQGDL